MIIFLKKISQIEEDRKYQSLPLIVRINIISKNFSFMCTDHDVTHISYYE
jgi:hypothetical protein